MTFLKKYVERIRENYEVKARQKNWLKVKSYLK